MITVRRSEDRGHFDHGWLDTRHTFSFADYFDPEYMGFRSLRVINEDRVDAGGGFAMHPHSDMEVVTYVLEGSLEHEDSAGNGGVIRPGMVQRMSAGTGIRHAERNPSATEPVHLLQIWILPDRKGHPPSYEQKELSPEDREDRLQLIASPDGRDGSVTLHQDAYIYSALLETGDSVEHRQEPERGAWLQVARGTVLVDGERLRAGDGAGIEDQEAIEVEAEERSEVLLFDLP